MTITCLTCGQRNADDHGSECAVCGAALVPDHAVFVDFDTLQEAAKDHGTKESGALLCVLFTARNCRKSRAISGDFERLIDVFPHPLRLAKVDILSDPQMASRFQVTATPTVLLLDQGRVFRFSGSDMRTMPLAEWILDQI